MFKITQPPVIIFGKYSVRDYSFPQNCLVVTSKGAIPRGWLEYLKLNDCYIFDKVESNPSIETAEDIISEFRNSNFSSIIGLGGGSSMDVAKFVANKLKKFKILIPTTFGSGSEVTRISVLKVNGKKKSFHDDNQIANVAIVDSYFMESSPLEIIRNSAIDATAQCSEGYDSKNGNPLTKFLCNRAFELLINKITESDKELALNHFMQGEFLMNQGNYALAVLEFQDAIDLDPNAATIHVSIADAYRRLGKAKRTEDHLRIALDLDPEETEAREMLGQLFFTQKNYLEAKSVFKELNQSDPDNLDYIYTLADLARIQKNWDLAIDYYIEGYEVNSMAIEGLEQALQIAMTTNTFDRAEELCTLLLEDDPDNIKLLETMRDLTLFSQNYELALNVVERIEKLQGSTPELLIQKSALYEELNNSDLALRIMYEAFSQDSLNVDILHRLVSLLMDEEENEQAVLYNQRIIDHFPDDPRGFINNAVMALSGKKPEEAILALSPHSDRFNQDFTMQYLLGTAYYQFKDYGNAKIHLAQALSIYPQSRNAKHNLALIYDSTGEWDESDKLYMELITTDSTDAQAFNNYAYSLVERGKDFEFALELAQNAIRLEPKSAAYLDTIGWIYFKMDRFEEAMQYIRESLIIDSGNTTIQEHLDKIIKLKAELKSPKIHQVENQD